MLDILEAVTKSIYYVHRLYVSFMWMQRYHATQSLQGIIIKHCSLKLKQYPTHILNFTLHSVRGHAYSRTAWTGKRNAMYSCCPVTRIRYFYSFEKMFFRFSQIEILILSNLQPLWTWISTDTNISLSLFYDRHRFMRWHQMQLTIYIRTV